MSTFLETQIKKASQLSRKAVVKTKVAGKEVIDKSKSAIDNVTMEDVNNECKKAGEQAHAFATKTTHQGKALYAKSKEKLAQTRATRDNDTH